MKSEKSRHDLNAMSILAIGDFCCSSRSLNPKRSSSSGNFPLAKSLAVICELLQIFTCPHEVKKQNPSRRDFAVSAVAKKIFPGLMHASSNPVEFEAETAQ
jgi:hypothetical protein